uniref:Uncharacterized protein n=1 Tax=Globodera rostochiensis TaxID=31243 RepID=A0A914HCE4_GLORO
MSLVIENVLPAVSIRYGFLWSRLADICGSDICGPDICGPDICGLRQNRQLRPDICGADICGPDICNPTFASQTLAA